MLSTALRVRVAIHRTRQPLPYSWAIGIGGVVVWQAPGLSGLGRNRAERAHVQIQQSVHEGDRLRFCIGKI
jgi:hypothetical protein